MKKLLSIWVFLLPVIVFGQNYNVALIPDSLLKSADAVTRMEELHIIIKSPSSAIIKHKYAITVLNEAGNKYAEFGAFYDKLSILNDASGKLFDATGKQIKAVKKKEMADVAYNDHMSLMTDNRIRQHNFYCKTYPYTIEYEEDNELVGIYFFPSWHPFQDERFSVQSSKMIVEMPADYQIKYKQISYAGEPVITTGGKNKTYTWQIADKKALERETLQPSFREIATSVYITPTDFEVGGYKGNMSSWENLGKFVVDLRKGRDVLPENVKQDVHRLTDGLSTKEEKVNVLYNYLQQNTHYISIQLGIGGWQPFDAAYVATKKYGDCKALANYMVSLLKEAGIGANYVLVTAGKGEKGLWEDFPAPYFNHAIMCVPNGKDSIWLECTSQTESAGYMGSFTGNRKALLIAEDGGHVVTTPIYNDADNLQIRTVVASIDATGNLIADVNTKFTGLEQEFANGLMNNYTQEERDKYLNSVLNLPTYKVNEIKYKETKGRIPVMDEHLKIESMNYATVTGKRIFIEPNLFNKESKLASDKSRLYDIEFRMGYRDVDSIFIKIPAGYIPEQLPKNVNVSNKFGEYSISYKIENDVIELVRVQKQLLARFPASDYPDLVKYYDVMYKADRARIVLMKKEG
ncbi:DUF3857 domain-containing protein [Chitinophagaceae bacterium LWZ2-11]